MAEAQHCFNVLLVLLQQERRQQHHTRQQKRTQSPSKQFIPQEGDAPAFTELTTATLVNQLVVAVEDSSDTLLKVPTMPQATDSLTAEREQMSAAVDVCWPWLDALKVVNPILHDRQLQRLSHAALKCATLLEKHPNRMCSQHRPRVTPQASNVVANH